MKKESFVTVIIPAYNAEKYIEKCIDSILNQTYKDIELIVVDDGSNDNTGTICDKIASSDKRLKIIHKKNAGVSAARNTGLSVASGDYITFVDADDWLDLDIIENAVNKYQERKLNYWGFKNYLKNSIVEQELLIVPALSREELIANVIFLNRHDYNLGNYYRASCGILFDRKVIMKYNIEFPEDLYIGEDAVFLMQYLVHITGINLISQVGYNYNRMNEKSTTNNCHTDMYEQCDRQLKYITNIISNINIKNNIHINRALVNFRWLMLTSIITNSVKLLINRQLSIKDILDDTSRWLMQYNDIMQENIDNINYLNKEYIKIYKHRSNLNKFSIMIYYLIPKIAKVSLKKIMK